MSERRIDIDSPALRLAYACFRDGELAMHDREVGKAEANVDRIEVALRFAQDELRRAEQVRAHGRANFAANALRAHGLPGFSWGTEEAFAYEDEDSDGLVVVIRPKREAP